MPIINITDSGGETRSLDVPAGLTLMEALIEADYDEIIAMCGGCCSCATCHVHIEAPQHERLPEPEEDELMLLEMLDNYDGDLSRLSCQIALSETHEGLEVSLVGNE